MEKRIGILKRVNCRKKRQVLMVLILILSFISVSAIVSGSEIDNQGSTRVNPEQKIGVDNTEKVLEQKQDNRNIDWTENWESIEEELQQEDGRVDKTESWEYTVESEREYNRNTEWVEDGENTEEELQQEDSTIEETENWENTNELEQADNSKDNQQNAQKKLEKESSKSNSTENQGNTIEKLEKKESTNKDNQQSTQEKLEQKDNDKLDSKGNQGSSEKGPEQVENKKIDLTEIQGSTGEKLEQKENISKDNQQNNQERLKKEDDINKGNQQNTQEKLEQKDNRKSGSKGKQESTEEKLEQVENIKTDQIGSEGSTGEKLEQNQGTKDRKEGKKSSESNLKREIKVDNVEYSSESVGAKTELKTGVYGELKSLKSLEVKPEIETRVRNEAENLENENVSPEIQPDSLNSINLPSEEVTPETKSEESSWNNLKLILSYPYSLRPFYTTQESVKISYKGSEAFGQQKVNIYLIKERTPGYPEEAFSNGMNNSTVSLEDVLNNNTESYIQTPATLNGDGDLSPLTFDPLPAGNYWILITLAGNGTEKPDSEKEVLLANYFEVLKYRMKAYAPDTLKEGENFEVNLSLKDAPAQNNYTYWAVLLKEDAYKPDEGIKPSRMTAGTRPLVNGVDIIKSLETNLTGYESKAGKDELKNEVQILIGKGNGTISIGEENQSTLSLKSHELPPGDYLLLAGAYENDEGLAGIIQKELRISAENSYGLDLESNSGNHTLGNISSIEDKISSFMGINSVLETPKIFISEEIKPYVQAKSIVETVRNPPKAPSFLLGFAGTLLIMLAILRIRR